MLKKLEYEPKSNNKVFTSLTIVKMIIKNVKIVKRRDMH